MTTKQKILAGSIAAISGVAILGTAFTTAYAATTSSYPDIVDKLAAAFNLNATDVAKVFAEHREEKQDERLDQLVSDGKLTADQRTQLESKQDEMHTKMEEIRNSDKTDAEKREAMKELHDEMREWMEANGIDLPGPLGKGGRGPRF